MTPEATITEMTLSELIKDMDKTAAAKAKYKAREVSNVFCKFPLEEKNLHNIIPLRKSKQSRAQCDKLSITFSGDSLD